MITPRKLLFYAVSTLLVVPAISFAEGVTDTTQPDNSKMNERDQDANALNAQDQGNSKGDIELTQKIRQAVVKRKSFSTNAKNIKIISLNGMVTLKGPVKSSLEKKEIEKIATQIAGNSKVTSRIDIAQ